MTAQPPPVPGAEAAVRTRRDRRIAVPAYFHPALAGDDWMTLARSGPCRAVILNAADGPGRSPDPALAAAAHAVRMAGGSVLGYVDTDYGARPTDAVLTDLARYLSWYPTTGVFLDRVAARTQLLDRYRRLVARLRDAGAGTVVLNPGVHPHPGYLDAADAVVTFEGPYRVHRTLRVPGWVLRWPAERFWHLVYATPASRLPAALRHAAACHAGTVYVTDRAGANPWGGLPGYFDRQCRLWAGFPAPSPDPPGA